MPLHEDVSTFTLTFGAYFRSDGQPARVGRRGTIRPERRRTHVGTGDVLDPDPIPFVIGADGSASVGPLPHSDADQLTPDAAYVVSWGNGAEALHSGRRVFVSQADGATVDFDGLVDVPGAPAAPGGHVHPEYVTDEELAAALAGGGVGGTGYVSDDELAVALASTLADARARSGHTGTQSLDTTTDSTSRLALAPAEREKLAGVATGATANAADSALRDRATHTGVQTTASIADLREYIEDTIGAMLLAAGEGLTVAYDDQNGTLTVEFTGTSAEDQDAMIDAFGSAVVGLGNIGTTYDPASNTLTISTIATVNDTNAALRDRATHTGTQPAATISDLAAAVQAVIDGNGTPNATPGTLVRRAPVAGGDAGGWAVLSILGLEQNPGAPDHATRRDWVEGVVAAVTDPLDTRLDTAEATLAAATPQNTPGTLVSRRPDGGVAVGYLEAGPSYIDGKLVATQEWANANAGTSAREINTVVRRDGSGGFSAEFVAANIFYQDAPQPGAGHSLARRDFVEAGDTALNTRLGAAETTLTLAATIPPHTYSPVMSSGLAQAAPVANRVNYCRVIGGGPVTVSRIWLNIGTSGGNVAVGVYSNTGSGTTSAPGALLSTSGSVPCPAAGTSIGIALATPVVVRPGMWLAYVADSATAQFLRHNGINNGGVSGGWLRRQDGTFPLPATPSGLVTDGSTWVMVGQES